MKFTIEYVAKRKDCGNKADLSVRIAQTTTRKYISCIFRNGAEKQITDGEYIRMGTAKEDPDVLIFTPGNSRNAYKLGRKEDSGTASLKLYPDNVEDFAQFVGDYRRIQFDKESGVHYIRRAS